MDRRLGSQIGTSSVELLLMLALFSFVVIGGLSKVGRTLHNKSRQQAVTIVNLREGGIGSEAQPLSEPPGLPNRPTEFVPPSGFTDVPHTTRPATDTLGEPDDAFLRAVGLPKQEPGTFEDPAPYRVAAASSANDATPPAYRVPGDDDARCWRIGFSDEIHCDAGSDSEGTPNLPWILGDSDTHLKPLPPRERSLVRGLFGATIYVVPEKLPEPFACRKIPGERICGGPGGLSCTATGYACLNPKPKSTPWQLNNSQMEQLSKNLQGLQVRCALLGTESACRDHGAETAAALRKFIRNPQAKLIEGSAPEWPVRFASSAINGVAKQLAPALLPGDLWEQEKEIIARKGGVWPWLGDAVLEAPGNTLKMVEGTLRLPQVIGQECAKGADSCGEFLGPLGLALLTTRRAPTGSASSVRAVNNTRVIPPYLERSPRQAPPTPTEVWQALLRSKTPGDHQIISRGAPFPDRIYVGVMDEHGRMVFRNTADKFDPKLGLERRDGTHTRIKKQHFHPESEVSGFTVFPQKDGSLVVQYRSGVNARPGRDGTELPTATREQINARLAELTGRRIVDGSDIPSRDMQLLKRGAWDPAFREVPWEIRDYVGSMSANTYALIDPRAFLDVTAWRGKPAGSVKMNGLDAYVKSLGPDYRLSRDTSGSYVIIRGRPNDMGDVVLVD